ncbi:Uncharacterized damage-inducible protein DinB (forms a four-helix bundle) [Mucilaginibacter mallensis]|uniref:Uncharacterized damage-inducible protein DinB (Forms a four-helix bundle) n=1 Tax=Mucilaginibacter mallensis TaxID=652787 RepID=A0A1H2BLG9_MUCMA|nr:DinB family protein [Mucilaginibacter mallensis]SDT59028.1 Uncharacterized damage-inducible protein DinB (forms a four-helix bundle) [Mucilaginibacter mallensis]
MEIIKMFLKEFDEEAQTVRKMLERVPNDKYDWQPHPKSMTIRRLATHIAELPAWVTMALTTDGLDFANNPYEPVVINNNTELLAYFEKNFADGRAQLAATSEEVLEQKWVLRNGDAVYMTNTKAEVVRVSISQIIHHRAQLGVFLRLLNIPIPGSYGPSADEVEFELQEQE